MRGRVQRGAFAKTGGAEQAIFDESANSGRLRAETPLVQLLEDIFGTSLELLRPDGALSGRQPLLVEFGAEQAEQRRHCVDFCQGNVWRDASYEPDDCATGRLGDQRREVSPGAAAHIRSSAWCALRPGRNP